PKATGRLPWRTPGPVQPNPTAHTPSELTIKGPAVPLQRHRRITIRSAPETPGDADPPRRAPEARDRRERGATTRAPAAVRTGIDRAGRAKSAAAPWGMGRWLGGSEHRGHCATASIRGALSMAPALGRTSPRTR